MAGYAQQDPMFVPAMRLVNNITNGFNPTVTTSFAHGYNTGEIVRLWVPDGYGMVQVDQQFGPITVTGDDTFTIALDTTSYDTFILPDPSVSRYLPRAALVTSVGDINSTLIGATYNQLPFSGTV